MIYTVVAVKGKNSNIGIFVRGNNGGYFKIMANGDWTFETRTDFEGFNIGDLIQTSCQYTVSDGVKYYNKNIVCNVYNNGVDDSWDDVSLLIEPARFPYAGIDIADQSNMIFSGPMVEILDENNKTFFNMSNPDQTFIKLFMNYDLRRPNTTIEVAFAAKVPEALESTTIFSTMDENNLGMRLFLDESRKMHFTFTTGETTTYTYSQTGDLSDGQICHVCIMVTELDGVYLYLNGNRIDYRSITLPAFNENFTGNLFIGGSSISLNDFADINLYGFRITKSLRYGRNPSISVPPVPYPSFKAIVTP